MIIPEFPSSAPFRYQLPLFACDMNANLWRHRYLPTYQWLHGHRLVHPPTLQTSHRSRQSNNLFRIPSSIMLTGNLHSCLFMRNTSIRVNYQPASAEVEPSSRTGILPGAGVSIKICTKVPDCTTAKLGSRQSDREGAKDRVAVASRQVWNGGRPGL